MPLPARTLLISRVVPEVWLGAAVLSFLFWNLTAPVFLFFSYYFFLFYMHVNPYGNEKTKSV
jgi:hypothetical protein